MEMVVIELAGRQGAWVAQSVKDLTSAQVMISQLVGSSPASGSVLMAQNLEPALDSVSPSLSAPPLLMLQIGRASCRESWGAMESLNLQSVLERSLWGRLGGSVG